MKGRQDAFPFLLSREHPGRQDVDATLKRGETMATIYRVDGTTETIAPAKGTFTLEEVWEIVGGYVEIVRLKKGFLLVDEEGTMPWKALPLNPAASELAGRPIVVTALHTISKDFK